MNLEGALLDGNRLFLEGFDIGDADMSATPSKELAVVACMDTRHAVERVLGLEHGDAKIIRNAGNAVDDTTLRSLIVAVHLLGVKHIAIMGHTKCGMMKVGRGEFAIAHHIADSTPIPLHEVMMPTFQDWLGGFEDAEEHVRRGVDRVRQHPYMPDSLDVFGLIYDNDTGVVRPVS